MTADNVINWMPNIILEEFEAKYLWLPTETVLAFVEVCISYM